MFHKTHPRSRGFHTLAAVAEILGCSTKTVRRWIEAGKITAYRVGRTYRIADADLEDYLKRCRV